MDKPLVVCLCGSTRFEHEFIEANKNLTLAGFIVLTVGVFGHSLSEPLSEETKIKLDELHKRKIDMCDIVYVINPNGYIGDSTNSEIVYASELDKTIYYFSNGVDITS